MSAISPNLRKGACHKCGKECFHICYVGYLLVCLECFRQVAGGQT